MPRLRKTLPNDIGELISAANKSQDYSHVYAALEKCELNARGGVGKQTVMMLRECTPELAKWLLDRGEDIDAQDQYGNTALYTSAGSRFNHGLSVTNLIELGANIHIENNKGCSSLHAAADAKHFAAVQALIEAGCDVHAKNNMGQAPLEYALNRLNNIDLVPMVEVTQLFLESGAEVTDAGKSFMIEAGECFEFHRSAFNPDDVEETARALEKLYKMIGVEPVPVRTMHDGISLIEVQAGVWQDQHQKLWDLLVPSRGAASTIQGEVIRISGRISDELYRNGGANWDRRFRSMCNAFCKYITQNNALPDQWVAETKRIMTKLPGDPELTRRITEFSVEWVKRNPKPIPLSRPNYDQ